MGCCRRPILNPQCRILTEPARKPNVSLIAITKPNLYKDSVALMRVAEMLLGLKGVQRATLVMGTPANKEILAEAKLLADSVAQAGPGDLIAVIDAENATAASEALAEAERLLAAAPARTEAEDVSGASPLRSLSMGASQFPQA